MSCALMNIFPFLQVYLRRFLIFRGTFGDKPPSLRTEANHSPLTFHMMRVDFGITLMELSHSNDQAHSGRFGDGPPCHVSMGVEFFHQAWHYSFR